MGVLYIKSLGTELQECQKENELLKKIIEIQKIKIEKMEARKNNEDRRS